MNKLFLMLLLLPVCAIAAEPDYVLVIKDHVFTPTEITIPAGKKIKLIVDNQDATPEEFHSDELNREKVILGNSKATIFIGPLKPGRYAFMGEFHEKTAKGTVVVE